MFDIGDVVFYAGTSSRPGANAEYHAVDERLIAKTPKIFLPKRGKLAINGNYSIRSTFDVFNATTDLSLINIRQY